MNRPNAHFDKVMQERLVKENQGFNMGRRTGTRPTTAVLAWRPANPFLTYERDPMTEAESKVFNSKHIHAKVMNDRIMVNNQAFVPGFYEPPSKSKTLKKSHSQEHLSVARNPKPQSTAAG